MFWRPLLLVAFLAISPAAAAQGRGDLARGEAERMAQAVIQPNWMIPTQHRDRGGRQDQAGMSIREAASIVQSRYGGRLLNGRRDGDFYILQWELPNGDRRDFRVNAVSGQIS